MNMPVLDDVTFDEFRATLGREATVVWLEKFLPTLALVSLSSPVAETSRDDVFDTAHLLIGRAGLVGCLDLVETCIEVQQACKSGQDFEKPYAVMATAAAEAAAALRDALARPD